MNSIRFAVADSLLDIFCSIRMELQNVLDTNLFDSCLHFLILPFGLFLFADYVSLLNDARLDMTHFED